MRIEAEIEFVRDVLHPEMGIIKQVVKTVLDGTPDVLFAVQSDPRILAAKIKDT